ncbi:hypothetical protein [Actinomadura mexicana]|uniref:Uncharacterized protein n=1 Tax=Actinomadura mexicana TaxID=134959 RepID=A0A238YV05_9ACTN|nr:hypothetical protein [Actinomadura mexicana]SNR74413.1 hypothetical protein SAMN06265355_106225 [Actinomadura mexicana]
MLAIPALTFTYGLFRIADGLDGERGPGLAWTLGHLAFCSALVLFVVVFRWLRALAPAGDRVAAVTQWTATAGAAVLLVQFGIDLVAGAVSANHLEMSLFTERASEVPGVAPVVYDFGPYLFYVGMLALIVRLAVARVVKPWTVLLILADLVMPLADKDLIPIGALLLSVSFAQIARVMESRQAASGMADGHGAVRPAVAGAR